MTPGQITATREALNLTRGQAARLYGIDARRYRRLEAGQIDPFSTLERLIAVALVPGVVEILRQMVAEEDAYAASHPVIHIPPESGQ